MTASIAQTESESGRLSNREIYQYPDSQPAILNNGELTVHCIRYFEDQQLIGEYNASLIPKNSTFPLRFEALNITPISGCDESTLYSGGVLTGTVLAKEEASTDLPYRYALTFDQINESGHYEFLIHLENLYSITEGLNHISGTYGDSISLSYQGFSQAADIELREAQTHDVLAAWNPVVKEEFLEFTPSEIGTWTVELVDHTAKQIDYFTLTYTDESAVSPIGTTPTITHFTPERGEAGDTVTLTGTHFDPTLNGNIVTLNGTPMTVIAATATQLVVSVPSDATSGAIAVTVNDNTVTTSNEFTVTTATSSTDPEPGQILLAGASISANSEGVEINDNVATITAAGTYTLSGTLNDGQIIVDTKDEADVTLILNGVNLSSSTNAPLVILKAENALLALAEGTENYLTDGEDYIFDDPDEDEPDAALFSKSDLTIYGEGALTVNANYNDGIKSKDGLIITGGNIKVNSVDDGIQGKDYLMITNGDITVDALGDGLKSSNDEDSTLGYVKIEGGNFNITSGADAIQAETNITISDGTLTLTAGGGSNASLGEDDSAKAIKANVAVTIEGGNFFINSADDAIHANENIVINAGYFAIASGDDGIHADLTLEINNGEINISKAYEGIESSTVTINGGTIQIVSSDDGINVAGGVDGSSPGRFGPSSGNNFLYINGGYIVVDANGDGLDANGSITMTAGTVLVNGPTSSGDSALDYDGSFNISGGYLLAVGSSGMAQAPDQTSSQYSILVNFDSFLPAGTLIHIENSDGEEVMTFAPSKNYQSIAFSSAELLNGSTYDVYYGGSSTGTETDGLYDGGTYTAGTEYTSLTLSDVETTYPAQTGGPGGFQGGGPGSRPQTGNPLTMPDNAM